MPVRKRTPPDLLDGVLHNAAVEDRERILCAARVARREHEFNASNRCPTCWLGRCICSQVVALPFTTSTRFLVCQCWSELYNAGDDAKLLATAAPGRTSFFVQGRLGDEEKLEQALLGTRGSAVVLFPCEASVSVEEFKLEQEQLDRSCGGTGATLSVLVLDGTWRRVKALLRQLRRIEARLGLTLPRVALRPETLSVYARTQSRPDRISTVEALALFLHEWGEDPQVCRQLVTYVELNNAALRS